MYFLSLLLNLKEIKSIQVFFAMKYFNEINLDFFHCFINWRIGSKRYNIKVKIQKINCNSFYVYKTQFTKINTITSSQIWVQISIAHLFWFFLMTFPASKTVSSVAANLTLSAVIGKLISNQSNKPCNDSSIFC